MRLGESERLYARHVRDPEPRSLESQSRALCYSIFPISEHHYPHHSLPGKNWVILMLKSIYFTLLLHFQFPMFLVLVKQKSASTTYGAPGGSGKKASGISCPPAPTQAPEKLKEMFLDCVTSM